MPETAGRIAVFDCFSGIAGDMTLAALVDAGASLAEITAGLTRLDIPSFELVPVEVARGGMRALHLRVTVTEEATYQPPEMRARIETAGFTPRVLERALAAVAALELGERLAHGSQDVHLHEAGGVDALIDLVGAMLALESLGIAEAYCPVVTVGAGTITRSAHGVLPAAPGPAAAHILEQAGFPMRFVEASHELVTPSGAAILAAVAKPGPVVIRSLHHGAGAGTMDPPNRPNALRIFIGERTPVPEAAEMSPKRSIVLLEANIDDMSPALLAHARDRLLEEGALDAWLEPIGMKKGRAASKLCALVQTGGESAMAALIMRETTTLGVRTAPYGRFEAERAIETFASSLGPVRVKMSELDGVRRAAPEFEDVKTLAARLGLPALAVQRTIEAELG